MANRTCECELRRFQLIFFVLPRSISPISDLDLRLVKIALCISRDAAQRSLVHWIQSTQHNFIPVKALIRQLLIWMPRDFFKLKLLHHGFK